MMRCGTLAAIALLAFAALSAAVAQTPPDGFAPLAAIADETAFVQAVKDGAREQLALAAMESRSAKERGESGDVDAAKALAASSKERIARVGALFDYALARYAGNAHLLNAKGEYLYDERGEQDAAVTLWTEAIALDEQLATAHNNLGIHYMHTGSYDTGLDHLERAIALEKDNPDFCFNLAQMYLLYPQEIERREKWKPEKVYRAAMDYSKHAAELAKGDYDLSQDYAVNFFAAARFEVKADWNEAAQAWRAARAAARTTEERFYTWLNEGRVWIQADKLDEARTCLKEALQLRPKSEVTRNLLMELDRELARKRKH